MSALHRWFRRSHPTAWRRIRSLRLRLGRWLGAGPVAGVNGPVHRNDLMLLRRDESSVAHYAAVAVEVLEHLDRIDRTWPARGAILDFGCGYGRLTRHLIERVPADQVAVFDTNEEAVGFCTSAFGVHGWSDPADLRRAQPGGFGTIVVFTVLTNLPDPTVEQIVQDASELLGANGLLVLTTHGRAAAGPGLAALAPEHVARADTLLTDLERNGSVFLPYAHGDGDTGLAWHTPDHVGRIAARHGLDVIDLREAGLDGLLDVFGLCRAVADRPVSAR